MKYECMKYKRLMIDNSLLDKHHLTLLTENLPIHF